MREENGIRILVPGDRVYCKGIVATIKQITYQDDFGNEGFDCEFFDTDGKYRSWKQRFDGGFVLLPPTPVPLKVLDHVAKCVGDEMPEYKVIDIVRASDHPADSYLYMVVAQHKTNGTYAVWTCWNEKLQALNYGHYDLMDMNKVRKVCEEFYHKTR